VHLAVEKMRLDNSVTIMDSQLQVQEKVPQKIIKQQNNLLNSPFKLIIFTWGTTIISLGQLLRKKNKATGTGF
jgi:hypothetical protein